jgi:hypothetical protein
LLARPLPKLADGFPIVRTKTGPKRKAYAAIRCAVRFARRTLLLRYKVWALRAVMRPAVADVVFCNERAHDGPAMAVDYLLNPGFQLACFEQNCLTDYLFRWFDDKSKALSPIILPQVKEVSQL